LTMLSNSPCFVLVAKSRSFNQVDLRSGLNQTNK
jgi:hypothetical protein